VRKQLTRSQQEKEKKNFIKLQDLSIHETNGSCIDPTADFAGVLPQGPV